ncbi:hypothetical protein [Devosia alba]|uniref:hypothetical protein n=1 Tax=Devosia alba TaxID=3152360 RepID=UPI003264C662
MDDGLKPFGAPAVPSQDVVKPYLEQQQLRVRPNLNDNRALLSDNQHRQVVHKISLDPKRTYQLIGLTN